MSHLSILRIERAYKGCSSISLVPALLLPVTNAQQSCQCSPLELLELAARMDIVMWSI